MRVIGNVPLEPSHVAPLRGRNGDDHERGFGQAGNGDVRLDPAARIEPLGIDELAHGHVDLVGGQAVEDCQRVAPFDMVFDEAAIVDSTTSLAVRRHSAAVASNQLGRP
jgi:hypothetical protein